MARKAKKAAVGGMSPQHVKAYLGRADSLRETQATAGGEKSDLKREFTERHGINGKALGWIEQLHRMEPDKRGDVLRSFDDLRHLSDLDAQEDMFEEEAAGEGARPVMQ